MKDRKANEQLQFKRQAERQTDNKNVRSWSAKGIGYRIPK